MAFFQVVEINPGGDIGAGRVDPVSLLDKIRQALGIGFAVQEVVRVPRSKHDQRLDWIVTEEGAVAAKAAGVGPS